jgi:putative phosphoribosyl transferase
MDFRDRREAGRRLGEALARHDLGDAVVLGLARGGVPVAYEVAAQLGAPLDVLVVRKVGAPGNPEYGLGAVAEDGVTMLDETSVKRFGGYDIDDVVARERREVQRRVEHYRGGRAAAPVEGRTAVIVDDGIATGGSATAAVRTARQRKAGRVIVAAPVGAPQSVEHLREEADEVICLGTPEVFFAVGAYYRDFGQTSDAEVVELLARAHEQRNDRHGDGGGQSPPRLSVTRHDVDVAVDGATLPGYLGVPHDARGLVVFAHGSGSSRESPRNQHVADRLHDAGFATLLFDLLTAQEERDRRNVFDIGLLARRLADAAGWARGVDPVGQLPVGLFGASTGAAAALDAAAELGDVVRAVVSRGGRPDLSTRLPDVEAPVLLIVGGNDPQVLDLNRDAAARLTVEHDVEIVAGASHLFEEPGTLDEAADAAARWFADHL